MKRITKPRLDADPDALDAFCWQAARLFSFGPERIAEFFAGDANGGTELRPLVARLRRFNDAVARRQ